MKRGRPDIRSDAHKEGKKLVPPQRRTNREEYEYVIDRKKIQGTQSAQRETKHRSEK